MDIVKIVRSLWHLWYHNILQTDVTSSNRYIYICYVIAIIVCIVSFIAFRVSDTLEKDPETQAGLALSVFIALLMGFAGWIGGAILLLAVPIVVAILVFTLICLILDVIIKFITRSITNSAIEKTTIDAMNRQKDAEEKDADEKLIKENKALLESVLADYKKENPNATMEMVIGPALKAIKAAQARKGKSL